MNLSPAENVWTFYRIEGFKGGPHLGHHYAEKDQSLGGTDVEIPVDGTKS